MLGGAWLLRGGAPWWLRLPRAVRLAAGLLLLFVAWLAVAQARVIGINFLLSILVLVWVADIFAYFAGRAWGGRFVTAVLDNQKHIAIYTREEKNLAAEDARRIGEMRREFDAKLTKLLERGVASSRWSTCTRG